MFPQDWGARRTQVPINPLVASQVRDSIFSAHPPHQRKACITHIPEDDQSMSGDSVGLLMGPLSNMGVRISVTVVGVPDVSPSLRDSLLGHPTQHDILSAKSRNTLPPTEYPEHCDGLDRMDGVGEDECRFEEIGDDDTAAGIEEVEYDSISMRTRGSEMRMSCARSNPMSFGDMPE